MGSRAHVDDYRLWYIRDAAGVRGPFPEALVCRFIVLGRLNWADEVSLDGAAWRQAGEVAELKSALRELLDGQTVAEDPQWSEERAKAALRWLDDRKAPDPRIHPLPQQGVADLHDMRSGDERRQFPETVEQYVYREARGEFDSRLQHYRKRYAKPAALLLALLLVATAIVMLVEEPVNPVRVGLQLRAVDCTAPAAYGVRWSGCRMDGAQLAGADLRSAELIGTRLRQANLAHADLSGANLLHADLAGADLSATRLSGAVWVDGRTCAAESVGRCR